MPRFSLGCESGEHKRKLSRRQEESRKMTKEVVAKWRRRIEDTFHGPAGIVGESVLKLEKNENALYEFLLNNFCGYVRLMDAFLGFYIETLDLIKRRQLRKWPNKLPVITAFHIPTLWRFRASYTTFWKGYYIEATGLLRGVFENALTIIALNKDIITTRNAFSDIAEQKIRNGKIDMREIRLGIKKTDSRIRDKLLGTGSSLSRETQKDFEEVFRLMHNSVHRSRINILRYYVPWVSGEKPFPLMPFYDQDLVGLYMHLSGLFGWILVRTFPFLETEEGEFPISWMKKRRVLDECFEESLRDLPKNSRRSYKEFIEKTFGERKT